ncbi:MAG TPA: hypothetical protein VFV96_09115 [Verrucomicrobiae bacterium]|nr:hypothetical protein [Verrucomicrobiae bacterium]
MKKLGMDPQKTSLPTLFNYIGEHHLGYRIVIQNFAGGANSPVWGAAVDNGMMAFAPHGNNTPHLRLDYPPGLQACVAVAGGVNQSENTYGPTLEFFDYMPWYLQDNVEQSWANQVVAAKFAKILDAHPEFNIWDAREYLRQTGSCWAKGWTERNGFGRPDPAVHVDKLLPGPPLEFRAAISRNARQVRFTWRNFLMSDFAATVIARGNGEIVYRGTGTNFVWTTDADGPQTFTYWSENQAGDKSRLEPFQTRVVMGLQENGIPACLVLAESGGHEFTSLAMQNVFQRQATNWICAITCRTNSPAAKWVDLYEHGGVYAAALPNFSAMADYAISNRYRLILVPLNGPSVDASQSALWEKAVAAGIAVVMSHCAEPLTADQPLANREVPAYLGAAITVGYGVNSNEMTYGPGLEFFDAAPPQKNGMNYDYNENAAAAVVAAKLARILDTHPSYNLWDARQHLRQSASYYADGWRSNGGYGRAPVEPAKIARLDRAPPLKIQAKASVDGRTVAFSWLNFLQTGFAATVIQGPGGSDIYTGKGTNYVWHSDVSGTAKFKFFSQDKTGRRSRDEPYTVLMLEGLHKSAR